MTPFSSRHPGSGPDPDGLFSLREKDFQDLKDWAARDPKAFTLWIEALFRTIKKKEDLDKLFFLYPALKSELIEISPLVAEPLNAMILLMIRNHFYKQLVTHRELLSACANPVSFRMLSDLVGQKQTLKFLEPVEIYQLKKLVLELSEKYKAEDVAISIRLELEKEDLTWRDRAE